MSWKRTDFSSSKSGDIVFTLEFGKSKILKIGKGDFPVLICSMENPRLRAGYTLDGKSRPHNKYPDAWVRNPFTNGGY